MRTIGNTLCWISVAISLLASACAGIDIFGDGEGMEPQVEILSFSQEGDTTWLLVDIVQGDRPLNFVGIAYSQEVEIDLVENQSLYEVEGSGTYDIPVAGLEPEQMYHFVAFVGQQYSLVESEADSFFVPRPVSPEAPCMVTMNVIEDRGGTYDNLSVSRDGGYADLGEYGLTISTGLGRPRITVNFSSVPTSGIYTTSTYDRLESKPQNVFLFYRVGVLQTSIDPEQDVFVEKLTENHYLISFCEMTYSFPDISGTWEFSGQVEVE